MENSFKIEINEKSKNIANEINNIINILDPIDLELIFNCKYKSDNENLDKSLSKINFFDLYSCKINSLSIVDEIYDSEGSDSKLCNFLLEKITTFLSFSPYSIKNINIDLFNLDINIDNHDSYYQEYWADYDFRLAHFFSKNKHSCKNLNLKLNYLFSKSIEELGNFTELENIKLNLSSVGCNICNCLKKIVRNNNNLISISLNLSSINQDKKDSTLWFLNLCEELKNSDILMNLKNINIVWYLEYSELDEFDEYKDKDLIFNKFLKKYYLNECKNILKNIKSIEYLNIEITCFNSEYRNRFKLFFQDLDITNIKNRKRKYENILSK
jgi:hypothetical protein